MVPEDRLHERINYWKTQLIDLSKRNRLLYFRPAPTTTVALTEPDMQSIFVRLVGKEQPFQFYPFEPEQNYLDFDEENKESLPALPLPPLRTDELRSNLSEKRLWRTLYSLRQKSRTSLQEQGLVTLFIAFGLLEWTESPQSEVLIQSPLVLVPVQILQESSKSNYYVTLFEDDVTLNPTLEYKLKNDFGLQLPPLPEGDLLQLDAYFTIVRDAISQRKRWDVIPEAYLSLFSFHKFAMYKDLQTHEERACGHAIVRALAGDTSRLAKVPSGLPNADDLDRTVKPAETFQILDADSSQQEAIQAAKRGVSLILQGPPGTGKSQTIANIIAECLADHKKVLFVSEKMAALEVVYRRLAEKGLGDFCLQAHSHKANKKEVIQELGKALNPINLSPRQGETDFSEFQRLKESLNTYVEALHTVRPPLNRTAYQTHGELARLETAPDLDFTIERVGSITPGDLTHTNEIIAELARVADVIASYNTYPWLGVRIAVYNPNQMKADIRSHFGSLVTHLVTLEQETQTLAQHCGVPKPLTLAEMDRLSLLAQLLERTPRPPESWFLPDAPAPLVEQAKVYQARFYDYHRRRATLLQSYQETVFSLPHTELWKQLSTRAQPLFERVQPGTSAPADTLVRQRSVLETTLAHIQQLLDRLMKSVPALAEACGLETPSTLHGITELCKTAEHILRDPRPQRDWFERSTLLTLKAEADEAETQYASYVQARDAISARYEESLYSLDLNGLYIRFTGAYTGFLRVLNPGYYQDRRQMRAELKIPGKLSVEESVRDLRTARQVLERKEWIETRRANHSRAFGRHYNSLETNWSGVIAALETTRQIVDQFGEGKTPEPLVRVLVESGSGIENIRTQRDVVQAERTRIEQELITLERVLSLQAFPFTQKSVRDAEMPALQEWVKAITGEVADFYAALDTVMSRRKEGNAVPLITALVTDLQEAYALVQIEIEVQSHAHQLQREYGHLFTGMATRWEEILAALDWTGQALDWFDGVPPATFVAVASGKETGAESVSASLERLRSLRQRIEEDRVFLHSLFPYETLQIGGKAVENVAFPVLRDWVQLRLDRLSDLDKWMNFQELRSRCQAAGLSSFLGILCRDKPTANVFKPAFYKRFWLLWLDAQYQADSRLANFDGTRHEEYIARFRELDRQQLKQAQNRLRERLLKDRPRKTSGQTPTGEMNILIREYAKKARHRPLRRLFGDIPNLYQALKPCTLMSPLSVATFLDPALIQFDVVVFDEASQICSEDAVGAIMRGKQVIVVGDSKQLPPTRFFATIGGGEEYDTEEDEADSGKEVYESILDECSTIGLTPYMLRWHYRSRCEALIAFSNHHFYEDRLVTFPGPHIPDEAGTERCVALVPVPDGVYVRGKGQDAGTNRKEAQKVAELIFQHFETFPGRSLGVIAFSERQMIAIDDEVRRIRTHKPEYNSFFTEDKDEPFFIKNLENVQGDERDTIIFSIGYGRDQQSKLSMNFGPVNKEGGERRLNVAVTRAKYQVKLVSSILPQDIDLSRTDKKGPKLLKAYLEFAQQGPSSLARELDVSAEAEFDSPFEEEVCAALEARGLTVHKQIGCAGYRIDLAVVDAEHPGRYLLGIECDGATYHSSKTARDRDRLRQQILEEMGWKGCILRIWSSDWISNRDIQIRRVLEKLASLRNQQVEPEPLPVPEIVFTQEPDQTEDLAEEITDCPEPEISADSFEADTVPYQIYDGRIRGTQEDFYILAENNIAAIVGVLVDVVAQVGPIHIEEATRCVVSCWGMGKAGAKLLRIVKIAATRAQWRKEIEIRGEFLWPPNTETAVVRVPTTGQAARAINYIPLEEIAEACFLCMRTAFAMPRDELIIRAARLLGYSRTGPNVRERMADGIDFCEKQGRVESAEQSVRIVT